jgi:hypothetical protein
MISMDSADPAGEASDVAMPDLPGEYDVPSIAHRFDIYYMTIQLYSNDKLLPEDRTWAVGLPTKP